MKAWRMVKYATPHLATIHYKFYCRVPVNARACAVRVRPSAVPSAKWRVRRTEPRCLFPLTIAMPVELVFRFLRQNFNSESLKNKVARENG